MLKFLNCIFFTYFYFWTQSMQCIKMWCNTIIIVTNLKSSVTYFLSADAGKASSTKRYQMSYSF